MTLPPHVTPRLTTSNMQVIVLNCLCDLVAEQLEKSELPEPENLDKALLPDGTVVRAFSEGAPPHMKAETVSVEGPLHYHEKGNTSTESPKLDDAENVIEESVPPVDNELSMPSPDDGLSVLREAVELARTRPKAVIPTSKGMKLSF